MLEYRSVTGVITIGFVFSGSEHLYQDSELMLQRRSLTGVIKDKFVFSDCEHLYRDIEFDNTIQKCDRCYNNRVCVFSVRVSVPGH